MAGGFKGQGMRCRGAWQDADDATYLVLSLKALGIMPALGRADRTGTEHVLSHPRELQVAKEVKFIQLD